jgi:predicted N-acetyltransferase YhbS
MTSSGGQDEGMDIDERSYRRPDLPRLIEQQVLDFGRIVWFDGSMTGDRFRGRMHEVPDETTHFVRSAGSILVSHVQVIPIELEGRDRGLRIGGVSSVLTYPEFRNEGHSTALLRRASDHIETSGMALGMLFCDEKNVSFYERLRWHALARDRVIVHENPDSEDRVMVLGDDALLPDTLTLGWSW